MRPFAPILLSALLLAVVAGPAVSATDTEGFPVKPSAHRAALAPASPGPGLPLRKPLKRKRWVRPTALPHALLGPPPVRPVVVRPPAGPIPRPVVIEAPVAPLGPTLALTRATVIDAHGELIHDATVVISGGHITAVGHVPVPAGAQSEDLHGHVLSCGLFDAASQVGLTEVGHDDEAEETAGADHTRPVAAATRVVDGFDPLATAVPVTRDAGVTLAALVPDGGLIAGQGAVVNLLGGPYGCGRVITPSFGLFGTLAPQDANLPGPASGGRVMAAWRELLTLARVKSSVDHLPFEMGLTDLAAIRELAGGERPLFLAAHSAREIEQALAFTRETHMKVVLLGAEEGWMLAGTLAAAQVPVILDPFEDLPRNLDRRGSRLDNAAILDHAGVAVAFGTWSSTNARDLRQAAGIAVANGMPWASAWRAVTSQPARLYGVAARYGELSVGHEADLVVWDGDPFEPGTDVLNLYVGGHPVTIEDRQRALARKYHRNHL